MYGGFREHSHMLGPKSEVLQTSHFGERIA